MRQTENGRPGVMLYFDMVEPALKRMTDEQAGMYFKAVIEYAHYGVIPSLEDCPITGMAFDTIRPKLDRDAEKYEDTLKARRYAAYVRYARKDGEVPMGREEWEVHMQSCEGGCIPTATSTATSTATATATTSSTTASEGTAAAYAAPPPTRRVTGAEVPADPAQRRSYYLDRLNGVL